MKPVVNHIHLLSRRICQIGLSFALGVGLLGASIAAAQASPADDGFEAMRRDDLRVAAVGYRVAVRNLALCVNVLAPQPGIVLHSLGQYDVADRSEVARYFDLGSTAGVEAVVPGGPADLAGIKAGDQIIRIGDAAAPRDALARKPSRATVEQSYALLSAALEHGPTMITISRHGQTFEVSLVPTVGCASRIELLSSNVRNAWADGVHIMIGGGLLDACVTDDDLAFVIAHEQVHNLQRSGLGQQGSEMARESDADRIAVAMTAGAAYDPRHALATWSAAFKRAGASDTHPAPATRIAMLQAMIKPR